MIQKNEKWAHYLFYYVYLQMGIVQLYLSETARQGLEGIAISLINVSNLIPQNSTRTFQENVDTALSLLQGTAIKKRPDCHSP